MMSPPFDPARVLGCDRSQAESLLRGKLVTPGEAESIAVRMYPWRRHLHDDDSYWITTSQAARILGVSAKRVRRLLDRHRLPYVRHRTGVRLMRREQIEALAAKVGSSEHPTPTRHAHPLEHTLVH
jgi:excisionase family DNA binding protein